MSCVLDVARLNYCRYPPVLLLRPERLHQSAYGLLCFVAFEYPAVSLCGSVAAVVAMFQRLVSLFAFFMISHRV